jgi:hypothetical protein
MPNCLRTVAMAASSAMMTMARTLTGFFRGAARVNSKAAPEASNTTEATKSIVMIHS